VHCASSAFSLDKKVKLLDSIEQQHPLGILFFFFFFFFLDVEKKKKRKKIRCH